MKKKHRFLIHFPIYGNNISISNIETIHLMKHVLKFTVGEECILFSDGSDDYLCTITTIQKNSIELSVVSVLPKKDIPTTLTACISITKRDSMELTVQKLTEIGVHTIVPIISERTIKQDIRIDRLQKISDEALEQSGGSTRVFISEPHSLRTALSMFKDKRQYYFDIGGEKIPTEEQEDCVFYIGPEGGWSDGDTEVFSEYGLIPYALGGTTLRAETAAIVAAYTLLWR
jgi:16S rRNA (uracil1498-N3)-methyltransferase